MSTVSKQLLTLFWTKNPHIAYVYGAFDEGILKYWSSRAHDVYKWGHANYDDPSDMLEMRIIKRPTKEELSCGK